MRITAPLAALLFFALTLPAIAQTKKIANNDKPNIIPLDQIHPGMKGTALTVFQGVKPESMDVEVLGILRKVNGPKGDIILVRLHGTRFWATRYDFPALKDGRVKRDEIPDNTPSGAQGWFINTRRPKFADARVREALNNAFDFEWTNKNIMYGAYLRTVSVFQNSDMMAQGLPSAAELALLEPYRARLPAEVFGEPYTPPVSDGSGEDRALLRKAAQLLAEAGCAVKNGKRVQPNGEPLTFEFLIDEPSFQPHHMPFIRNLALIGIDATLRIVDPVQYRARRDDFDFDITIDRFSFSATPGESLRSFFTSQAAALKGSNNLAGMADPVIDALVDAVIAANSRPALVTACRALDRVIRAGRYWIPNWYKASHWIAYWDVFGRPAAQPRYFRGIPDTWWSDPEKAAKIPRSG